MVPWFLGSGKEINGNKQIIHNTVFYHQNVAFYRYSHNSVILLSNLDPRVRVGFVLYFGFGWTILWFRSTCIVVYIEILENNL